MSFVADTAVDYSTRLPVALMDPSDLTVIEVHPLPAAQVPRSSIDIKMVGEAYAITALTLFVTAHALDFVCEKTAALYNRNFRKNADLFTLLDQMEAEPVPCILEPRRDDNGKLKEGMYLTMDDRDFPRLLESFVNGLRDGVCVTYGSCGKVAEVKYWEEGVLLTSASNRLTRRKSRADAIDRTGRTDDGEAGLNYIAAIAAGIVEDRHHFWSHPDEVKMELPVFNWSPGEMRHPRP